MKRLLGLTLAIGMLAMLGGCVYDPAYYHRPGVVYDDGSATYGTPAGGYDYDDYYAPGYYYGSAYSPWYGYGGWYPWVGVGFYGSYYHGYHGHGGWHGHGGGGWHGHSGGSHGHSGGGSHGGSHH